MMFLGIDIGGSWIKGILIQIPEGTDFNMIPGLVKKATVIKVRSRLGEQADVTDFIGALDELTNALEMKQHGQLSGIGISTAGVVDYAGKNITLVAKHLSPLKSPKWMEYLRTKFNVPVVLSNDADAAAIGAASLGYLTGNRIIGVMPVGTGLGFTLWRNGRKWMPNFSYTLLGCIETPCGSYDEIASVSALASLDAGSNLCHIFTQPGNETILNQYIVRMASIVRTTHAIYHTDKILFGGGLAEAITETGFPFCQRLQEQLKQFPPVTGASIDLEIMSEGNTLPLIGAVLLAVGEQKAEVSKYLRPYSKLSTEIPFDNTLQLQDLSTSMLMRQLWNAEQQAGEWLEESLVSIADAAEKIAGVLEQGGRLIYVGAGTSGRLAAADTVEIACTFGFPRDKVLTLIAGGVADAAIDIETNFEEDASSVPEMLLAGVIGNDIVVGISVSGSAYYVQSALGFAKGIGAYTILIQEETVDSLPFCDAIISLRTGYEVVAGSTRMKAGTATKKVLNFLSTSAMVRLGKVTGSYMTEVECINEKLISRAQHILKSLFGLNEDEAYRLLAENHFVLNRTIRSIQRKSAT